MLLNILSFANICTIRCCIVCRLMTFCRLGDSIGTFEYWQRLWYCLPVYITLSIPHWDLIGSRKRWLTALFGDRADPRLTVRSMLVRAQWTKGEHRTQLWFAHGPVVVSSLPVQSSPPVYSQCTACSPRINRDLIKFFGIVETFGNGLALNEPDLRHSTDTYCRTAFSWPSSHSSSCFRNKIL